MLILDGQPSASETVQLCFSTRGPCLNVEARSDLADDVYSSNDVWALLVDARPHWAILSVKALRCFHCSSRHLPRPTWHMPRTVLMIGTRNRHQMRSQTPTSREAVISSLHHNSPAVDTAAGTSLSCSFITSASKVQRLTGKPFNFVRSTASSEFWTGRAHHKTSPPFTWTRGLGLFTCFDHVLWQMLQALLSRCSDILRVLGEFGSGRVGFAFPPPSVCLVNKITAHRQGEASSDLDRRV